MCADRDDGPPTPSAEPGAGLEPEGVTHELDPEWDEVFGWSYGQRAWNIGCG